LKNCEFSRKIRKKEEIMGWIIGLGLFIAVVAYVFGSLKQVNDPNFFAIRRFGDIVRTQTGLKFVWALIEQAEKVISRQILLEGAVEDIFTRDRIHVTPRYSLNLLIDSQMTPDNFRTYVQAMRVGGLEDKVRKQVKEIVLEEIRLRYFDELFEVIANEEEGENRVKIENRVDQLDALDRAITQRIRTMCRDQFGIPNIDFYLEDLEPEPRMAQLLQDPRYITLETARERKRAQREAERGRADAAYHREVADVEIERLRKQERVKTDALKERAAALAGHDWGSAIGVSAIEFASSLGDAISGRLNRGKGGGDKKK